MLRDKISAVGIAVTTTLVLAAISSEPEPAPEPDPRVRIGVYDSRAIAIAWARTEHNPVGEKMAEHREAEAAGDEDRVADLEAWGEMHQRKLHFQGFGRYPVDEYLKPIEDEMAKLMEEKDLDAIVWMCHARGEHVETVDITLDLVDLYEFRGRDRVVAWIEQLQEHEPADFETLYEMDPRQ